MSVDETKITEAGRLHAKAMGFFNEAVVWAARENLDLSDSLMSDAFELEREAAMSFVDELEFEPTRSILFNSAAALAMRVGRYETCKELAAEGMRGRPRKRTLESLSKMHGGQFIEATKRFLQRIDDEDYRQ